MFGGLFSAGRGAKYDFTDDVRAALYGAREAASGLRHDYVGGEHLLLGLLRVGHGPAHELLAAEGLSRETIEQRLLEILRPGTGAGTAAELPYTSLAKKVLELTMAAARELGSSHIGTDHLLLGLLSEPRNIATQTLRSMGLDGERVRQALRGEATSFRVRIDDASDLSIYEQIVAQVQEGVAIGILRPGMRLPPVRQLADELDIAPGTVARAYGRLEADSVVVTDGARGTRIADRTATAGQDERFDALVGLLRPVAVAAFHMGASAAELRSALDRATDGIFTANEPGDVAGDTYEQP